ncbi:MAG TPA: hypothetical protein PK705_06600 [Clostridia bacterium]|jgi:hypothetical protein|nr:hypothetical protein [Clostridia bacterium]
MTASMTIGKETINFTEYEWTLLRDYIIRDTLEFWDSIAKDVDGGLLPMELAGTSEMIDRNILYALKSKLAKVIYEKKT